jgi:hypothetical protein
MLRSAQTSDRPAYSRRARICAERSFCSLVNTQAYRRARNIFRPFSSLANDVVRFCFLRGLFYGHFGE